MEKGVHPIPLRTRKLSPSSPMILLSSQWESRPVPGLSFGKARKLTSLWAFLRWRQPYLQGKMKFAITVVNVTVRCSAGGRDVLIGAVTPATAISAVMQA